MLYKDKRFAKNHVASMYQRQIWPLFFVFVCMAGCRSSNDGSGGESLVPLHDLACEVKDGTRLRHEGFSTIAGRTISTGLNDSEYGLCDVLNYTKENGTIAEHCIPRGGAGLVYYTDPNCQTATIWQSLGNDSTDLIRTRRGSLCESVYEMYSIEAPLNQAPAQVYRYVLQSDSCEAQTFPTNGVFSAALGPLPSTLFVETTREDIEGERLSAKAYAGSDGSRICSALVTDNDLNTSCSPLEDGSGRSLCVPNQKQVQNYFTDDSCTTTQRTWEQNQCGNQPAYAYETLPDQNNCETTINVYETLSDPVGDTHQTFLDMCVPTFRDQLLIGERMDNDRLATVFEQTDSLTEGRIKAHYTTNESNDFAIQSQVFWDSKVERTCSPFNFGLDNWRCVPTQRSFFSTTHFSDSECTAAVELVESNLCRKDSPIYGVRNTNSIWELVEIDEDVFEMRNGNCQIKDSLFFTYGTQVEASSFERLINRTL